MATDTFTDDDATPLENHDPGDGANWTGINATYPVTNLEINSNVVEHESTWQRSGAYYSNGQSEDQLSEIVFKGGTSTDYRHAAVRLGSDQRGYAARLDSVSGGNWTRVVIMKNGVYLSSTSSKTIPWADDHTVKITASGNSSVDLEVFVDDSSEHTDTDSSSPITGGYPGFWTNQADAAANSRYDDWTDGIGGAPDLEINSADTVTSTDSRTATDAVAHDASSSSSDTNTTTLSWSHTCTGNQLVLTVGVVVSPGSISVSSVKYNNEDLTLATNGRQAGTNVSSELWYKVGPATGSNTVAVTLDGTAYAVKAGAVSFRNASQSANPLGTVAKQTGTGTSSSLNVTSDGDHMVIDVLGKFDDGTATINSGQTQRWQEN